MGKCKKHTEEDKKGWKKGRRRPTASIVNQVQKKRGKTARNGKVKYSFCVGHGVGDDEGDGGADDDEDGL